MITYKPQVQVAKGYENDTVEVEKSFDNWSVSRYTRARQGWEMLKVAKKRDAIKFAKAVAALTGMKYVPQKRKRA